MSFKMLATPHPNTLRQIEAPQPNVLIPLLCVLLAAQLPHAIDWMLVKWAAYADWSSANYSGYLIGFFAVSLCLDIGFPIFLFKRHGTAIRPPKPAEPLRLACLWVLMPLLIYHVIDVINMAGALHSFSRAPEADSIRELASTHEEIWGRLAFGSSLTGIILVSITAFTSPILEELVFSGFVINFGLKRFGAIAAIALSAALFSLSHAFQYGFVIGLIPVFWAGATYGALRVFGGSVWLAVIAHWTINTIIFIPKWMVAIMHFSKR